MTRNSRLSILLGVTTAAILGTAFLPRIPQNPAYHNFADQRALLGIPNCLNVISNLPFLFVGIAGCLLALRRGTGESRAASRHRFVLLHFLSGSRAHLLRLRLLPSRSR